MHGPMKEAYDEAESEVSGKKPKDAPKLPKGWHYMPDGKVMKNSEHEEMEEKEEEEYE